MGRKTKISWCDSTWSPVTGCLRGCEYCYARRIAERFGGAYSFECIEKRDIQGNIIYRNNGLPEFEKCGVYKSEPNGSLHVLEKRWTEQDALTVGTIEELEGRAPKTYPYPFDFDPTFHRYLLDEPQMWKKPKNIFVCSMADLFGDWVPDEWIKQVFDACAKAPQHRYLFLTKNPERYACVYCAKELDTEFAHDRMLFGTSATSLKQLEKAYKSPAEWLSIEPILGRMWDDEIMGDIAELFAESYEIPFGDVVEYRRWMWVVIGAETGNRKNKIIPKKEWITEIADVCKEYGTPVFMKESLRDLMGDDFRQEFPWEV